jgi:hypothetical protein
MSFVKTSKPNKARRQELIGETREQEAARLAQEIAVHPVTRCPAGERNTSSWRSGWSSKPIIPISQQRVAEEIAKKMLQRPKPKP